MIMSLWMVSVAGSILAGVVGGPTAVLLSGAGLALWWFLFHNRMDFWLF